MSKKQTNSPERKAMLAARREFQRGIYATARSYRPSRNDEPAYRKSIWPLAKVDRRAAISKAAGQ